MFILAEPRVLGILLFELHAAISEIGRRKVEAGLSGPDDLQEALLVNFSKKILWSFVRLTLDHLVLTPFGLLLLL